MRICLLLVIVLVVLGNASSKTLGNVLALNNIASPSHHIWDKTLWEALAAEGYNVTALSADVGKKNITNLHYIQLEAIYDFLYNEAEVDLLEMAAAYSEWSYPDSIYEWSLNQCRGTYKSKGIQTLMNYPDDFKFDLIIHDSVCGPCLLGFMYKFKGVPLIEASAFHNIGFMTLVNGNPIFPSFVPSIFAEYEKDQQLTFMQRSRNLAFFIYDIYLRRKLNQEQSEIARTAFGPSMTHLGELESKADIFLINQHPSWDTMEPLYPNVISVAALQVKKPQPLPNDIKAFIEAAPKGAVLFCLGSNMRSDKLGKEKINMFIRAISRLPDYHFLWKFESDTIRELPKNLIIKKWLSQSDILAHPGVKLFLSHSGLLSTHESIWHGVPVLGMPFFMDQHKNIRKGVKAGVAEKLDFFTITEDEIVKSVKNIIENPSYSKKMKALSTRFRDRPQEPLELAVYWCKYLIRHGEAPHLRSKTINMPHYIQHMWDIVIIWGGLSLAVPLIIVRVIKKFSYDPKKNVNANNIKKRL